MINYFENVMNVIEKANVSLNNLGQGDNYDGYKKDLEVYNTIDFELAKALISDWESVAVQVAKMILAHKDISDIKVKFE